MCRRSAVRPKCSSSARVRKISMSRSSTWSYSPSLTLDATDHSRLLVVLGVAERKSLSHREQPEVLTRQGRTVMQPRMKNPASVLDGATNAIFGLIKATQQTDVPETTLGLVHLRASQINGCSF